MCDHVWNKSLHYKMPLHVWNQQNGSCGFSMLHSCKAKVYDASDTGATCPWMKAEHDDYGHTVKYLEHCTSHVQKPFYYGKNAVINERIFGASFLGVLPANLNFICILFKRRDYGVIGLIANTASREYAGYFTLQTKSSYTPQIQHCYVTNDLRYLIVTELYNSPEEFAAHLFNCESVFENGTRLVKFKQVGLKSKLHSGEFSRMLCSVVVSQADRSVGYVVLPQKSRDSMEKMVLYDFNTSVKKAMSMFPWSEPGEPDDHVWLQNVVVSPDGALLIACCQTAQNGESGSFIVIHHSYDLNVLHAIHMKREPEYWWGNAYRGCYSTVTPTFSSCGYQMALLCWSHHTSADGVAMSPDDSFDGRDTVAVFHLPCLALDLRSQCRKVVLYNIKQSDIEKLVLPIALKDFLKYE